MKKTAKRLAALMLAVLMGLSLVSCGAKPYNYDLSEYITLGNFSDVTIKQSDVDTQLKSTIESLQSSVATTTELKADDVLADGDATKINFTGKMNDEEFEGGSGKDYDLTLGSNMFIDGFESGMVGHKVGETFDLELTFPEDYKDPKTDPENAEKFNGKPVTFTVTVTAATRKTTPAYDDALVAANTSYATVAEYEEAQTTSIKANLALTAFEKLCSVKDYPDKEYKDAYNDFFSYYQHYASMYNQSLTDFVTGTMGSTMDEMYKQANVSAGETVKGEMIYYALARANGLDTLTKDEIAAGGEKLAKENGFKTLKEMKKTYDIPDSEIEQSVLFEKVSKWIAENVKIDTTPAETSDKASETSEAPSTDVTSAVSEETSETSEAPTTEPDGE